MTADQLFEQIKIKESFLCIGLDTDLSKIPQHILACDDPIFEFNKAIIDATADHVVAVKPNLAFYEVHGAAGWNSLSKTLKYIRSKYPELFLIADAKRGDITSTAKMYARTFFQTLDCDSITISPYMGKDSVAPFLEYANKWVILLALTSNDSFSDFQMIESTSGKKLFEEVIEKSSKWGNPDNTMYVVGATRAELFSDIRKVAPEHFLLVPGVGEQGGSLKEVAKYGLNSKCGLLVNSSRGIIYADSTERFADAAKQKAMQLQKEMEQILVTAGF
ncbi:MAG: orotidine-5'-phosphate decarboxylase [Bacteroidales bacterium]|nr:MAG: orotidine-5'-phosphate decarboxylase [Bacteroidales bacterium]